MKKEPLLQQYQDLLSSARGYLKEAFENERWVFSTPDHLAFFSTLKNEIKTEEKPIKAQVVLAADTPKNPPSFKPQSPQMSVETVHFPQEPVKPQQKKLIEEPQPKTQKEPANDQITLQKPAEKPPCEFSDIRKFLQEKASGFPILDQIPNPLVLSKDSEQKALLLISEQQQSSPLFIKCLKFTLETKLAQALILPIDHFTSKESQEALFNQTDIRLILSLTPLQNPDLRKNAQQKNIPYLELPSASTFIENPDQKRALWETLKKYL